MLLLRIIDEPGHINIYHQLREKVFGETFKIKQNFCLLPPREKVIYVGIFDDNLIGGAYLLDRGNQNAQIHQLFIDKPYRGKGHGKKLIQKTERIAYEKGFLHLYAHTHISIQAFYEKCGYLVIREAGLPKEKGIVNLPPYTYAFVYKKLSSGSSHNS